MSAQGGVSARGVSAKGGCLPGGVSAQLGLPGGSAHGGCLPSACWDIPPCGQNP